jgi:putative acetyltransferase
MDQMEHKFTDSQDYDIRYTRITDISYLKRWLIDPRVIYFFPFNYNQVLEIENFSKNWVGFGRINAAITATYQSHPIGMATLFLMPYKKVSHAAILNIVVDPIWQNKGVGTSLIRNSLHLAKTNFRIEFLQCEVMENNPIISILKKQGFKEIIRQEGFYKNDNEYFARIVLEAKIS